VSFAAIAREIATAGRQPVVFFDGSDQFPIVAERVCGFLLDVVVNRLTHMQLLLRDGCGWLLIAADAVRSVGQFKLNGVYLPGCIQEIPQVGDARALPVDLFEVANRRFAVISDLSYNPSLDSPGIFESILDQLDRHDT
jgi:hypothetical protein